MPKNLTDFVVTRLLDIISNPSLELLTTFATILECDPQNTIKFLPKVFSIYLNLLVRSDDETRTTIFGYLEIVVTKSRVEFMQFMLMVMPIVCQSISTLECLRFACVLSYKLHSQFSEYVPALYFTVCNYLKSWQLTGLVRHFRRLLKFASFAILNQEQTIEPFLAALDKCELGHFVLKRLILLVPNVDVRLFISRLARTAVRLVSLGVVGALFLFTALHEYSTLTAEQVKWGDSVRLRSVPRMKPMTKIRTITPPYEPPRCFFEAFEYTEQIDAENYIQKLTQNHLPHSRRWGQFVHVVVWWRTIQNSSGHDREFRSWLAGSLPANPIESIVQQ
jgi:hypothetical protein